MFDIKDLYVPQCDDEWINLLIRSSLNKNIYDYGIIITRFIHARLWTLLISTVIN